jgi:hypothetical protein
MSPKCIYFDRSADLSASQNLKHGARMKLLLPIIAAVAGLSGTVAQASDAGPGLVHNIYVMEDGVVLFHLTGARTSPPACVVHLTRWAFDSTTPAGQAKMSLLLTAYTSQKPVAIHGASACPHWVDTESVSHFMTAD